jgi:glycosyltransferase involved in cell wall biosynthesis
MTSDIKQLTRVPLGNLQLRYLLKKMECLIAVSKAGAKEFNDIGFPESHIEHIPNGVVLPHDWRMDYTQVKRVISTARLSKEKGIDILLKSWANVVRQEKGVNLIILGYGPLERELKMLCQSLGMTGSVTFMGTIQDVIHYLESADLFVLPSRAEGLSNSLLEAMSYGIPCIATEVGGNIELLEPGDQKAQPGKYVIGRNGLLINPDDIEGLGKAILYLIRNRDVRERLGRMSQTFCQKHFSIDLVADKYIDLYERVLKGRV